MSDPGLQELLLGGVTGAAIGAMIGGWWGHSNERARQLREVMLRHAEDFCVALRKAESGLRALKTEADGILKQEPESVTSTLDAAGKAKQQAEGNLSLVHVLFGEWVWTLAHIVLQYIEDAMTQAREVQIKTSASEREQAGKIYDALVLLVSGGLDEFEVGLESRLWSSPGPLRRWWSRMRAKRERRRREERLSREMLRMVPEGTRRSM